MIQGIGDGRYPVGYREVAGVRMPYRVTVTWLNGKSTTQLSDIQPNIPIEAAKFVKPRKTGSRVSSE